MIRVITQGALKRLITTGMRPSSCTATSNSAGIVGVTAIPPSESRARRVLLERSEPMPPLAS